MIVLNLLPKEAKKQIKLKKIMHYAKQQIMFLFVLILIVSILLISSKIFLERQVNLLVNSLDARQAQNLELNNKIKNLNQETINFQKTQENFICWSCLIIKFNQLIPSGINISSLSITANGQIDLNGIFNRRSNFVKLQDNLKNSEFILEINSSSKNLLKTENNEFNLNLKTDMNKIKKWQENDN